MAHFITCIPSKLTKQEFITQFGGVFEHSAWVAERAYEQGLTAEDNDQEVLHDKMASILISANREDKMAVILAHPDLAGKAAVAGDLTPESTSEQASAGINLCNAEEFAQFTHFNDSYKAKFNFPFIMAVKGANRHLILGAFEQRLQNTPEQEFEMAIQQINKIALFRLREL